MRLRPYREFNLSEKDQLGLYSEIEKLITNPDTQFIFTTPGHNEIAMTGSVIYQDTEFAVVGTIDRMIFHDDAWYCL